MSAAGYFQAAIPEPFRIFGLPLKPLSLGRYALLKRFGCAFVDESESQQPLESIHADLLLGVLICSMRCDEFIEWAASKHFVSDIQRWRRKICPLPWIGLLPKIGKWWRAHHSFNLFEKSELFRSYIREGSVVPKYWLEDTSGRRSAAHWVENVEAMLRAEANWTEEEINEAPLSKALAQFFKHAEAKGIVRLMTPDEIALIEALEKDTACPASN